MCKKETATDIASFLSPPSQLPEVRPKSRPPAVADHVGIHALEVYTPRQCGRAIDLERLHQVEGKYTKGPMMHEFAVCDEDEDIVSMALTVVHRLMRQHNIPYEDVGMLQVGSESLLDRAKSIKSHIMQLFEESGNHNVEGVDTYHACYGGTAALLQCRNWVESRSWDGRWAITVTTDVSDGTKKYPFLNGGAAVAILVGPDAPLAFEGARMSHMRHEWDFYKPVGWHAMAPHIDGPGAMQIYFDSIRACQRELRDREGGESWVDGHDHLVFHLGGSPKFVKHSFEQVYREAHGEGAPAEEIEQRFEQLVLPSLRLAQRIGMMHTSATYVNLCSLLLHDPPQTGSRIGVFSFGSASACTMYHLRVRDGAALPMDTRILLRLDSRRVLPAADFVDAVERYSGTYGRFHWKPGVYGSPEAQTFKISRVHALGKRDYELVARASIPLDSPVRRNAVIADAPPRPAPVPDVRERSPRPGHEASLTPAPPRVAPPSDAMTLVQTAVVDILPGVDADAPLVEAGLDSLGQAELQTRLSSHAVIPDDFVTTHPTVRSMAAYMTATIRSPTAADARQRSPTSAAPPAAPPLRPSPVGDCVFVMREEPGSRARPVLVVLHSIWGTVDQYAGLAKTYPGTVLGIQHGYAIRGDEDCLYESADAMIESYRRVLEDIHYEHGDLALLGGSFGGSQVIAIAQALKKAGRSFVKQVVLIDPPYDARNRPSEWLQLSLLDVCVQMLRLWRQVSSGVPVHVEDIRREILSLSDGHEDMFVASTCSLICALKRTAFDYRAVLDTYRRIKTFYNLINLTFPPPPSLDDLGVRVLVAAAADRSFFHEESRFVDTDNVSVLTVQGDHLQVVQNCATNRSTEFAQAFQRFVT